jgi:hypothetical protein
MKSSVRNYSGLLFPLRTGLPLRIGDLLACAGAVVSRPETSGVTIITIG